MGSELAYRPAGRLTGADPLMTDRIALFLGLVIFIAVGVDFGTTGGAGLMFLAQKFLHLIDWVIFRH